MKGMLKDMEEKELDTNVDKEKKKGKTRYFFITFFRSDKIGDKK